MTKFNKNALGFTAVEAVIIVLIVAALGAGGWFVYHKNQESNKKSTTNSTTAKKKTDSKSTPNASQTYFAVSEWGVKAPYTGTDRFTYTLSDNDNLLTAISKDLMTADPACSTFGAGQIVRYVGTDKANADGTGLTVEQTAAQNPDAYTKIGNYYYQFHHAQSGCGSTSIAAQNQANADVKALVANFKSNSTY